MKGGASSRVANVLAGAVVALAAAAIAAAGVSAVPPASHDVEVVGVVGLGWTGLGGGLARLVAALAMLVPIGTRALRAGLASAGLGAACAWVAFDVAHRFTRAALAPVLPGSPRLVVAVAAAAALAAVLGPAWQGEASVAGGAVTGALVVLLGLREGMTDLAPAEGDEVGARAPRLAPAALLVGLAATVDVLVLIATLAAVAPRVVSRGSRARRSRGALVHAAAALVVGLAPVALALATLARAPEGALDMSALSGLLPWHPSVVGGAVDAAPRGRAALVGFVVGEIGPVVVVAAGAGTLLVAHVLRRSGGGGARVLLDALLAIAGVIAVGAGAVLLGVPATPSRVSGAVLAAHAAVHALAAVALAAAALGIARAPVPFAPASAALVVVLEMVLPVRSIDDTLGSREGLSPRASAVWAEAAWGAAPPAAVLLVAEPGVARRIAALRATGELRGDLLVVPSYDPRSRAALRALAAEPKLAPLYRDVVLGAPPEELSLAELAAARPLLVTFEPRWDRSLSRHLLPVGLVSRFDPEPRGPTDRRRAFDAFSPVRERLVRVSVVRSDPALAAATASLLRARAMGVAATGDRELLSRALDDLRPFAPEDPVAAQLVRRIVTTKGPIDVQDLAP